MDQVEAKDRIDRKELRFLTSRSSGPGGQNVNKVNTKVELRYDVLNSSSLNDREKERILIKLRSKLTSGGELVITSQTERTQSGNREKVLEKFYKLISSALTDKKPRKATAPTGASKAERLKSKKHRGEIKKQRQSGLKLSEE